LRELWNFRRTSSNALRLLWLLQKLFSFHLFADTPNSQEAASALLS
jgi:hypothetical protein